MCQNGIVIDKIVFIDNYIFRFFQNLFVKFKNLSLFWGLVSFKIKQISEVNLKLGKTQ